MVFGSDIVGVYTVRFDRERSFDAQDLQLAKALALQATLAIRLTQLGEQAKSAAVAQERERAARERAAELNRTNAALQRTLARLVTAEAPGCLPERHPAGSSRHRGRGYGLHLPIRGRQR